MTHDFNYFPTARNYRIYFFPSPVRVYWIGHGRLVDRVSSPDWIITTMMRPRWLIRDVTKNQKCSSRTNRSQGPRRLFLTYKWSIRDNGSDDFAAFALWMQPRLSEVRTVQGGNWVIGAVSLPRTLKLRGNRRGNPIRLDPIRWGGIGGFWESILMGSIKVDDEIRKVEFIKVRRAKLAIVARWANKARRNRLSNLLGVLFVQSLALRQICGFHVLHTGAFCQNHIRPIQTISKTYISIAFYSSASQII